MSNKRARVPFEEEVTGIVKMVLSNMEPELITRIVQHLLSDEVGATCIEDLEFLTPSMLPSSLGLKPIKAAQLLKYFTSPGACASTSGSSAGGSSAGFQVSPHQPLTTVRNIENNRNYNFSVPWNSLPKETLDKLAMNERNKVRANQNDIDTLKLAIVKKLVSNYTDYKDSCPGMNKHPGSKLYTSITDQVFQRFPYTLADVVNDKQVGDGKASFQRAILVCTENQMREKNAPKAIPNAIRATGLIGVLEAEYLPNLDGKAREEQEAIRNELQIIYNEDSDTWCWDEIKEKMLDSYELQRNDTASAKVAIEQAANNKENEETESDDPPTKALFELMNLWPFLFYPSGLTWHHNRLTGRDLQVHLDDFLKNHLEYTLHFLTSCSKANKKNMALNLKLEKKIANWSVPQKLLKAVFMIANHFGEEKYNFIHSAERTTPAKDINTKGLADICIIARDNEPFAAEQFFICADEVILLEVSCAQEAITGLVQLAFVLDLDYPKMPLTFEFLERFVFGMGLANTRVKNKKGKALLVLTPVVRTTINDLKAFESELQSE